MKGLRGIAVATMSLLLLPMAAAAQPATRWEQWQVVPGVVDVVGPRADGRLVAAATGRLVLVGADGQVSPFADGPGGYSTPPGPEPYLARSPGLELPEMGCWFERDDVYALELGAPLRVVRIDASGRAGTFAELPGVDFLSGIGFDTVGRFGRRLLVTARRGERTVVLAVDCRARVTTVVEGGPVVEGGIEVAPASFGRFAGALIAPDELSGDLIAFRADGTFEVALRPDLPTGGDIGVESVGFVPPGFFPNGVAYLADRRSPGAPTEGTDTILRLSADALAQAGVREGDLIVTAEAAGRTVAVRCATTCTATRVADATPAAHAEGHVTLVPAKPPPAPTAAPGTARSRWLLGAVAVGIAVALVGVVLVGLRRRSP